jgi:hypothetical protein
MRRDRCGGPCSSPGPLAQPCRPTPCRRALWSRFRKRRLGYGPGYGSLGDGARSGLTATMPAPSLRPARRRDRRGVADSQLSCERTADSCTAQPHAAGPAGSTLRAHDEARRSARPPAGGSQRAGRGSASTTSSAAVLGDKPGRASSRNGDRPPRRTTRRRPRRRLTVSAHRAEHRADHRAGTSRMRPMHRGARGHPSAPSAPVVRRPLPRRRQPGRGAPATAARAAWRSRRS